MRVLIDECLNWRLGRALTGHFCASVQRMGWKGIRNGELLARMEQERIDVFITGDRNLQFQQHLPAASVAAEGQGRRKNDEGRKPELAGSHWARFDPIVST